MPTPAEIRQKIQLSPEGHATSIRPQEAEFLYEHVKARNCVNTLEAGFAHGYSAAHIMSASTGRHVACDPFQEAFKNAGLQNIDMLGMSGRLEFHALHSHTLLPRLLEEGRKFDFIFIDGDHRFDAILVDFYYAALLLRKGGTLALHDTWMRSTVMVGAFIRKNRKDFRELPCPHSTMMLFEKIGNDDRKWNHWREFYTLRSWLGWMARRLSGTLK